MKDVTISLLAVKDAEELFRFEVENRTFFETIVPSRGDRYYEYENFKSILAEIVEEQEQGFLYMYLLRDSEERIVGRINLVSVVRGIFNKAELGFRIGENYNGNGYATKGVKLILEEARHTHKLHRIEAGTSPENIGSQIVMIKNGFQFTGRSSQFIYLNNRWWDSINFEKILDK